MPCPVPNPPITEETPNEVAEDANMDINSLDTKEKWLEQLENANRATLLGLFQAMKELKLR